MADAKKVMTLEVDMDTGEITKQLNEVKERLEDVGDSAGDVGKKGGKGFAGLGKAAKMGATGFKLLGKAIIATGIGAIVAIVGGLVAKLLELKPVTDAIEKGMAILGATFKVLADLVMPLGQTLIDAFNNPKEAVESLREKFVALGDYMKTLLDASINPVRRGLLNIKRAAFEAAIGTKEFFGGDASEMKQAVREIDNQLADLVVKQEENKEKLKEPFVELATYIKEEVIPAVVENATAAVDLADKQIKLRDAQRALNLEQATSRAEIAELKRQSDDLTLSIEERVAAAQEAAAKEEALRAKREGLINREIALLREEQAIQGETEERTQRINELRIEQQAIIEEGLGIQTEMMTKVQGLEQELEDARIAFADAQEARERGLNQLKATLLKDEESIRKAAQEQELADLALHYEEQLRQAEKYGFDTKELLETQQAELDAMEEAHRLADLEADMEQREKKLQMAMEGLSALQALNEAFSSQTIAEQEAEAALRTQIDETENVAEKNRLIKKFNEQQALETKAQKRAFNRGKALQIAQALISTYLGATKAFTSQLIPGDPTSPIRAGIAAGIAVTSGLAQVAAIKKQRFEAPAPMPFVEPASVADSGGGGGGGGAGTGAAPTLDLSFLGDGASTNLQAFVLSNEVTNSQQQDQLISDQASLPG